MSKYVFAFYSLKEGIMQLLVINGKLAHFGTNSFPSFGFECLFVLFFLKGLSHLHDPSVLDEEREVEGWLFNPSLSLKIFAL